MIQGFDHIESYVGNAHATAYFFTHALGFRPYAQAGLETGRRDRHSYCVQQGKIRLVFTNPLSPRGDIARHVRQHGDAIRDIALTVEDAQVAFERCLEAGAEPIAEPHVLEDAHGSVRCASVGTFGNTVHTLVERGFYRGAFLPGFCPWRPTGELSATHLVAVDHVACCVESGSLDRWVDFYERAFGFGEVHHEDIVTEQSAMNSKVVGSANGVVKLPLMEPASHQGKSQIDEFLEYHGGAGAQHLAFLSDDIVAQVEALQRGGGVDFLETPDPYYDALPGRVGTIREDIEVLRRLNVVVDRDPHGYLLQVFTRPVTGRPTGFLEVIQRRGARGFGGGNVRALFEAVERVQAARGNL